MDPNTRKRTAGDALGHDGSLDAKRHGQPNQGQQQQPPPQRVTRLPTDPKQHDKKFPFFRRPRSIGCFSIDVNRKFIHDRHQMRFYCPARLKNNPTPGSSYKRVNWDLNEGLSAVVRKDPSFQMSEGIGFMLKWILLNKDAFRPAVHDNSSSSLANSDPLVSLSTDFVCFRGICTKVMCTPYERREGWQIYAVKHRGTIYLRQMDTDAQIKAETNKSQRQKDMCSWGYKFEQYMQDDLRKEQERESRFERKPVNENEEFCAMYRTRLGNHSVVYGAEMDGFQLKNPIDPDTCEGMNIDEIDLNQDGFFVELKTSRTIDSPRLEVSFARYKIIKWWCQCFLVGIPVLVCGFRDDDGIVTRIMDYPVSKLPKMGENFWLPNVCMNFLDTFFAFAKNQVQEEDVLYKLSWDPPGREIRVERPRNQGLDIVLPDWYRNEVFKL